MPLSWLMTQWSVLAEIGQDGFQLLPLPSTEHGAPRTGLSHVFSIALCPPLGSSFRYFCLEGEADCKTDSSYSLPKGTDFIYTGEWRNSNLRTFREQWRLWRNVIERFTGLMKIQPIIGQLVYRNGAIREQGIRTNSKHGPQKLFHQRSHNLIRLVSM